MTPSSRADGQEEPNRRFKQLLLPLLLCMMSRWVIVCKGQRIHFPGMKLQIYFVFLQERGHFTTTSVS